MLDLLTMYATPRPAGENKATCDTEQGSNKTSETDPSTVLDTKRSDKPLI